jgi:hypothetical protein
VLALTAPATEAVDADRTTIFVSLLSGKFVTQLSPNNRGRALTSFFNN